MVVQLYSTMCSSAIDVSLSVSDESNLSLLGVSCEGC